MGAWWDSLSAMSQFFACVAIPATVILIIQTVLMFIGIGSEFDGGDDLSLGDSASDADVPDLDTDFDGMGSLHVFTIRGIIAFFVVFGWIGYAMGAANVSLWMTIPAAVLGGAVMMVVLALLLRSVMMLRSGGNLDNRNALGTAGTVYLTVPPARSGVGKVNVLLQGSYVERDAVTDEEEPIPTGAEIVVTGISGQTTLVINRK